MTNTALLIVDVQVDNCSPEGARAKSGAGTTRINDMLVKLKQLTAHMRSQQTPIIFTQHTEQEESIPQNVRNQLKPKNHRRSKFLPNTPGIRHYGVIPQDSDRVFTKTSWSAFSNTDLGTYLNDSEIENLIVTGVDTQCCVLATVSDAFTLGYNIIVPSDCVSTKDENYERYHLPTIEILDKYFAQVTSSDKIMQDEA